LPFGLLKANVHVQTFKGPNHPNLAFFDTVCQTKNFLDILPFFGLFWMLKKIVYLKACFGEMWAKLEIFYEILNLNHVILTNFWRKFGLYGGSEFDLFKMKFKSK